MTRSRKALTLFDDYRDMLADEVRMRAYAEAIRRTITGGESVVDLGAGLGILGFLALEAGASRVFAIEKSDAVELARAVAERNGFDDRVVFLAQDSRQVELPKRVDVLLSETLGSFGVDENTLEFTIDARERFLKPGGLLIPRRLRLFAAPVEDDAAHERVGFWRDVAGIDYSPAIDEITSRMGVATIASGSLLAGAKTYAEIDLGEVGSPELEQHLHFRIERPGTLHGFAGWFELELTEDCSFDTAPSSAPTHWKQAFFPLREAVEVGEGAFLVVVLRVAPSANEVDATRVSYDYYLAPDGPPRMRR